MDSEYYLVSPMLKALVLVGKRVNGEARRAVSEIFLIDNGSYLISRRARECWKLENEGYSVLDCW